MKISRMILAGSVAVCLLATTTAFASVSGRGSNENRQKMFKGQGMFQEKKDPIKMLENKKVQIQTLLKDGKITQEQASQRITEIDKKIKAINEFNSLTLEQKKEKLTHNLKDRLAQAVKDGKLTQAKADEILKNFNSKLSTWNGTGYPGFGFKGGFGRHGEGKGLQNNKSLDSKNKYVQ